MSPLGLTLSCPVRLRPIRIVGTAALPLIGATPATAHERWVNHELLSEFDRTLFETVCPANVITLLGILALCALLVRFSARERTGKAPTPDRYSGACRWAPTLLGVTFGLGLMMLVPEGAYTAPDLMAQGQEGTVLIWLSGAAGLLLLTGCLTRPAGWLSLGIFIWALVRRPFQPFDGAEISVFHILNYLDVAGIAIYLGVVGRGALSLDRRRVAQVEPRPLARARATGFLRIFLGLTLLILGVQKFIIPELPMGVVQNYADKIYEPLYSLFGVSPEVYVFSASVVEASVGLLLILGVFTRPLMVVLLGLFSFTALVFKGDLVGHLPLLGIVLALFIEGGGAFRAETMIRARRRARQAAPASGAQAALRSACLMILPLLAAMALLSLCACSPTEPESQPPPDGQLGIVGEAGQVRFVLETQPAPPVLGEFFTVLTTVEDVKSGKPATGGNLSLDATMPEHGHGMMTLPQTRALEDGRYVSEGFKFHMHGRWVFMLEFESGGVRDRAEFEFPFAPIASK